MKNIKSIILTELKDTIPEIRINDFHASDYKDLNDDPFPDWKISECSLIEEYENPDTGETYYKRENESKVTVKHITDYDCAIELRLYLTDGVITRMFTTLTIEDIILEDDTHITLQEIMNDTENNEYTTLISCEYLCEEKDPDEWKMELINNKCATCDKDNKTCGYFSLDNEYKYKRCKSKKYNIAIDNDMELIINQQPNNN